jgi:hypothetical protein
MIKNYYFNGIMDFLYAEGKPKFQHFLSPKEMGISCDKEQKCIHIFNFKQVILFYRMKKQTHCAYVASGSSPTFG